MLINVYIYANTFFNTDKTKRTLNLEGEIFKVSYIL